MVVDELQHVAAAERRHAGCQFVKSRTKGIKVGALADLLPRAAGELRSHVFQRADDAAVGAQALALLAGQYRKFEVDQLRRGAVVKGNDVGGRDVEVQDTASVYIGQGPRQRRGHAHDRHGRDHLGRAAERQRRAPTVT